MDYFGINTSDDLPKIQEILNNEILEATRLMHSNTTVTSEEQTEEKDITEHDTANTDPATEVAKQDSGVEEEGDNI